MTKYLKKTVFLLIIVLLISSCFTGCKTFDNFKSTFIDHEGKTEEKVRIGVFEPLSGENKEQGELEKTGIELAHELYSKALGKEVELVYADNKSDLTVAETMAKELIEKRPAVILGSFGSTFSLIGNDIFKEADTPAIAVTCSNPLVTNSSEYYFRVCYVESFQGIAAAKYAVEEMKVKKAAILKESNNDYAAAFCQAFSDKFKALTKDEQGIVSSMEYNAEDKTFKEQLNDIKKSGAEVIFLPSEITDAANIMKEAKKLNIDATFLGTDKWENEDLIKLGGKAVEGAAFSTYFDSKSAITETTSVFLEAYQQKYGKNSVPDSAVALGFDAYLLAVTAINQAGTAVSGKAVKEVLEKTKGFIGASGNITFDKNGDPIKSVSINTVKDGKIVYTYTVEPTWS
ncbi:ABC transporter substrate-binding protein [Anaerovorax odorimutans]|uniref:ABC transporter substrate-binding protein n=1 Tax=Anaerovorax odorimutans TaxID=109327 RepID=UPI0003FB9106|nr:ABC transporter substrate-binding protein [Anaerovorax odorimutans]